MPLLFHSSYPPLPFLFPSSPPRLLLLLFWFYFWPHRQTTWLGLNGSSIWLQLEPLSTGCSTCACSRLLLLVIHLFLSLVSAFLFWHTSWHIPNIAYSLPRRMFPTELIISNANQRRASATQCLKFSAFSHPVYVCVCVCIFLVYSSTFLFCWTFVFYLAWPCARRGNFDLNISELIYQIKAGMLIQTTELCNLSANMSTLASTLTHTHTNTHTHTRQTPKGIN